MQVLCDAGPHLLGRPPVPFLALQHAPPATGRYTHDAKPAGICGALALARLWRLGLCVPLQICRERSMLTRRLQTFPPSSMSLARASAQRSLYRNTHPNLIPSFFLPPAQATVTAPTATTRAPAATTTALPCRGSSAAWMTRLGWAESIDTTMGSRGREIDGNEKVRDGVGFVGR